MAWGGLKLLCALLMLSLLLMASPAGTGVMTCMGADLILMLFHAKQCSDQGLGHKQQGHTQLMQAGLVALQDAPLLRAANFQLLSACTTSSAYPTALSAYSHHIRALLPILDASGVSPEHPAFTSNQVPSNLSLYLSHKPLSNTASTAQLTASAPASAATLPALYLPRGLALLFTCPKPPGLC